MVRLYEAQGNAPTMNAAVLALLVCRYATQKVQLDGNVSMTLLTVLMVGRRVRESDVAGAGASSRW